MKDHFKRKLDVKPIIGVYMVKNLVNKKIYIGQSIDIEKRWLQHKYGNSGIVITKSIKKYGLKNFEFTILEIVDGNLINSEIIEQLIVIEQKWMDKYKSYDKLFGYNINKTSKPNKTPKKGQHFGELISKIKIEMNHCGKPIIQYSLNGEKISEWKSAADVERNLNFSAENISASCLKKSKTSNGFIWRFQDDVLTIDEIINSTIKKRNRKKVLQMGVNNEPLNIFNSLKDAGDFLNIKCTGNITHACKGDMKTYKGYKWKYINVDENSN